jgi:hypothetical protein
VTQLTSAADVHLTSWWHPLQRDLSFGCAAPPALAMGPATLGVCCRLCGRQGQANLTALPHAQMGPQRGFARLQPGIRTVAAWPDQPRRAPACSKRMGSPTATTPQGPRRRCGACRLPCILSVQVLPCAEQPGGLTVSLRAPRDVAERVAAAVLRRRAARAEAGPAPRHDENPLAERVVGAVAPPEWHPQPGGDNQPAGGGGQVTSEAGLTVPIGHTRFSWLGEVAWLGRGARSPPPEREARGAPPAPLQPPSPSRQPSWPPPLGHTTFSWAAARDAQGALCVPAEPSRHALVWLALG